MSDFNSESKDSQQPPYYGSEPQNNNQYGGQQSYNNDFSNEGNQPPRPNNNLVLAIVATVLSVCSCCGYGGCLGLIAGIVAIVFATQVDSKYKMGDYFGAQKSAKNSKMLSYVSLGLVALSIVYIIVIMATGGMQEMIDAYQQALEQYQP